MKTYLPYVLDMNEDILKSKDPNRALAFWSKMLFTIGSCEEAEEVFPDMTLCPVCFESLGDDDFRIKHKMKESN